MPTLETTDGKPVDVTPLDSDAINAQFSAAMNDDGPDEQALPKRTRRAPTDADEAPKPRRGRAAKEERSRVTAATSLTREARIEGAKGLHAIGAGIAALVGKATGNTAYLADSLTISAAAEDGAKVLADTADADPQFAAVLDKLCAVGPWGALITYGFTLGGQLARNHRPALAIPGTVHPDELLAAAAA